MAKDIVRVLRLVEYVGPRDLVEEQVKRSIHGTRIGRLARSGHPDEVVRITATTIGEFPQNLEQYVATVEAKPFGEDS